MAADDDSSVPPRASGAAQRGTAPEAQKSRHAWREPRTSFWVGATQRKFPAVACAWMGRGEALGRVRRREAVRAAVAARARRGDDRAAHLRMLSTHSSSPSSCARRTPHLPSGHEPDARARAPPAPPLGRRVDSSYPLPAGVDETRSLSQRGRVQDALTWGGEAAGQKSVKFFSPPHNFLRLRRAQSRFNALNTHFESRSQSQTALGPTRGGRAGRS